MPNVTLVLPVLGEDPYGEKLLAAITALRDGLNGVLDGAAAPLPLGPVAIAGDPTGKGAPAGHVHPTTGLATVADLENAVITGGGTPPSRTITAGTGLAGGGTLEADRTISVVFGTTADTVCEGDDTRVAGAVQADSTLGTATTNLVRAQVAGDLRARYAVRADGTVTHGDPPVAVTAVTGTTTVSVTTAASHNLGTGDVVEIDGVEGYDGANGVFTITRVDADTFTLDSTTGSGTYTTGGTVQRNLGGTGSALEGIVNVAADGARDVRVTRGHHSGTGNLDLWRDHLGQPIAAMPQSGGFAMFGDDIRVFAGGDIFNSEVNLRSDGTIRARKGDTGSGAGVFALGNATTVPSANPDGTHTVAGASTVAGIVGYALDGRLYVRTSSGHIEEFGSPNRRVTWGIHASGSASTFQTQLCPAPTLTNATGGGADTSAGNFALFTTPATTGTVGGVNSANYTHSRVQTAPYFYTKIVTDNSDIANTRYVVGLVTADRSGGAGPASTGASTATGIYFRYDAGIDTTAFWRTVTCDGTTATVTTTTAAIAASASLYELRIEVNAAISAVRFFVGDALVATHTANIPAGSTQLGCQATVTALANAAKQIRVSRIIVNQE